MLHDGCTGLYLELRAFIEALNYLVQIVVLLSLIYTSRIFPVISLFIQLLASLLSRLLTSRWLPEVE